MPALTIGQVLVNEILPPELRDYTKVMDSGALESTLSQVIEKYPEQYRDISAKLMRLGNRTSVESGVTLRLSDTLPTFDRSIVYKMLDEQEDKIRNEKGLTDKERAVLLDKLYSDTTSLMFDSAYDTALKKGNPFALQVKSKARGNKAQLGALMASPGVYTDTKGNPVPMFIRHSYADGLSPAELWAGAYGARNGVVAGKQATRKGGELGKLLASAAIDQVVTEEDCGSQYGMPVSSTDKDNIGSVLAYDAGGHKAGEVITKATIQDFVKDGIKEIAVRSPVTCQAKRGVCAHCAGIRETGSFPEIGYNLGVNAASALSEKIAQGGLNCLAEGTLVRMADGSTRPIEKVEPGEMVLGSDLNGNISPTRVVARYDNGVQPCISTRFIENGTHRASNAGIVLESTPIHPILGTRVVIGQSEEKLNWVPRMLEVGRKSREFYAYVVRSHDSATMPGVKQHRLSRMQSECVPCPGNRQCVAFKRVEQKAIGLRHVYDLEVECKDHIYLLANGLIVHNTKHSGRLTSGAGKYQGFELIKSLTRVPQNFPNRAAVAPKDGEIDAVREAPQGGTYITVGGENVYVPPGYDINVKVGDHVEAGDQLSDGVIDPKDVVKYKGIGEGRRYFTERLTKAFRDSGYPAHRRNVESVARALVDHVQIENEDSEGQMLPGDVTTYTNWAFGYSPRQDSVKGPVKTLIGKYLERPVLHYTIGTKITKRVADELDKFGVGSEVVANENPIEVTPVMQSIVKSTGTDRDWMSRLGTTYLKSRLLEDAQHGSTAYVHGTNPIPGLAKGTEFGNYFDPGVHRPGGYTY